MSLYPSQGGSHRLPVFSQAISWFPVQQFWLRRFGGSIPPVDAGRRRV